jgi:hypothetical protein
VQEGNFFTDDLGSDYDIALLFNISHGLTQEQNIVLLQKSAKALNPGGFSVILEQFYTNLRRPMSRAVNNILGLSYFHLLGGQVYAYEDVEGMFWETGYKYIQRINLRKVPGKS